MAGIEQIPPGTLYSRNFWNLCDSAILRLRFTAPFRTNMNFKFALFLNARVVELVTIVFDRSLRRQPRPAAPGLRANYGSVL